jgi:hypothetical protein
MKAEKATGLPTLTKIVLLAVIIFTGSTQSKLFAATNAKEVFSCKGNFEEGKKPAKKEKAFKNQNTVKVFPDAIKRKVHVIARQGNKKDIEFLVFDINGNMVLNYKMKAGEKKTINELKKGSYMYHVFAEDEYLTTGKIVFR